MQGQDIDGTAPAQDDAEALPSKSARKRAHKALQDLASTLLDLSAGELERVCSDPELRGAVEHGRSLRKGARARHVRHLGNLFARADVAPIQAALQALRGVSAQDAARLHRAERWRDRLLADDDPLALPEVLDHFPHADRQRLRTLVRLAREERARAAPPRRFRELLRLLRDLDGVVD